MGWLDYFRANKSDNSAVFAKERLQVIVAHERRARRQPDYFPQMQREILEVIRKYVNVEEDKINVSLESNDDFSVLELNVTLPDAK